MKEINECRSWKQIFLVLSIEKKQPVFDCGLKCFRSLFKEKLICTVHHRDTYHDIIFLGINNTK